MTEVTLNQVRSFRLRAHHLDREYGKTDVDRAAGACGLQNSPPGAWETALHNRIPECGRKEMEQLLYREKTLLQAWSFRGLPVIFPAGESGVFLGALAAQGEEPWIYTDGIGLALDFLGISFEEVFEILKEVIAGLDGKTVVSKAALDQTLAGWMRPYIPEGKRALWDSPSMYGSPDKQTVGGAAVSFLLRPCSFLGLAVFGEREKTSPSFTSYKGWLGHEMKTDEDAVRKLVTKFLHCYGPASPDMLAAFLGCSGKQARRMWGTVSDGLCSVTFLGKKKYVLEEDMDALVSAPSPERELVLLGGHDPFLDQRDRLVLQPDQSLHKKIWKFVSNPGVILLRGEAAGVWTGKKTAKGLEVKGELWNEEVQKKEVLRLAEEYAAFRGEPLASFEL